MPRALSDIVDEICEGGWLKAPARSEVLEQIALVKRIPKLPNVKALRFKAKKAAELLEAETTPEIDASIPVVVRQLALLTKVSGPDPRFNDLQWLCAHAACVLIEEFGTRRPVGSEDGNTHAITQLIYEAITTKPQSGASCLGAAKSALAWRKSIKVLNLKRSKK
jgi:hypothetical protein